MSLFTSSQFASAAASGTDWRDTSKNILEKLEAVRTDGDRFNFGFLYISDHLADDATSILNLFRSVMKIENWIGSIGMGVMGCGQAYVDQPAISALIGRFPEDSFCIFPKVREDSDIREDAQKPVKDWLARHDPMLVYVHGDPLAEEDPAETLAALERTTGGFLVGGLTSSRAGHMQIAGSVCGNTISGAFFSGGVPVATTVSQGCSPIGAYHKISKADQNMIEELDGGNAVDVFQQDLKKIALRKMGEPDSAAALTVEDMRGRNPEDYKTLFKGQVYAAFPVFQSDQNDYLVRHILGLDPAEGTISVSQPVFAGDRIMFVERDEESVARDLSASLLDLRRRVEKSHGAFEPKGALYVSCITRGFSDFRHHRDYEMDLIREIIGSVPLAGFYAGGEISNARIYGCAGVLTLFL